MSLPPAASGQHQHQHPHPHHHDGHAHDHHHRHGARARLGHLLRPHSHEAADKVDGAMTTSASGMRALWVSLAVLAGTAALQAAVVAVSGSVALLGDTLHNAADALTAVPLAVAFIAGRRPPTRRYTYGYGRAEDLAGVVIVLLIAASSALASVAAVSRLAHPRPVSGLAAVAVAAVVGFAGNEAVARYRITVGRRIGSAALVADGLHARTDGFTSLAVLLGAGGVALGWDWADPVVGLLITLAILATLRQAAREIWRRLMDAVDPALVDRAEQALRGTPGVLGTGQVRLRWIGHQLRAECEVIVDAGATFVEAHEVAVSAEHALLHALPRLTAALVHADPLPGAGTDHHAILSTHRSPRAPALALGNAVVLKPDVQTAVSGGVLLARLFELAGLPEGVLHVLPGGAEPGGALAGNPDLAMISFTGSTAVGRLVGETAGRTLKRVSVDRIVTETVAAGAELRAGGTHEQLYYQPTVLAGVTPEMAAFREEIFGPVAPVIVVRDADEAVRVANDTEYGLVAAVQTGSVERGLVIAERLNTGIVHVNDQTLNNDAYAPFGGTGASGNGSRFGSQSSWDEFTQWQWVTARPQAHGFPF